MARRKQSPVQKAYNQQRRRLQRLINSYEKKGIYVDFELPNIPKRVTQASIRRLQNITYKEIRKKSYGIDISTGEKLSFNRAIKMRKDLFTDLPLEDDIVISNFRSNITVWNEYAQEIIISWLDRIIDMHGKKKVADMLKKAEAQGMLPNNKIVYDAILLRNGLAQMLSLMDLGNYEKDKLIDYFEYEESYEV